MGTINSTHDSQQLAGTRWRLDPSGSTAEFRVPNLWGLTSDKGSFGRFDGWLEVDDDRQWHLELTVDAASLDTGNRRRDRHLSSVAFFDVEHHPEVRFRSRSVHERGPGRLQVEGELEAAGGRVPLPVEVTVKRTDNGLVVDAAATVDQRQLGMTYSPLRMVRTPTAVRVHARLRPEH